MPAHVSSSIKCVGAMSFPSLIANSCGSSLCRTARKSDKGSFLIIAHYIRCERCSHLRLRMRGCAAGRGEGGRGRGLWRGVRGEGYTTIVNVALPHIAGGLSTSFDEATWTLTSYLVANGIVLTISGWLSTVFGRKRYFLICLGMFTVCSFFCGTATSLSQLVIFRLLQGFFGGGLQPTQQAIILDTFPPEQRAAAFGVTAIATIVAAVLGPTLGGYLTDTFNWRRVFLINIPIGVAAVFFASILVEDPPWLKRRSGDLDYVGLALHTLGLGCFQVMLDRGENEDWFGSCFILLMAVLGGLGILGAIGWLLIAKKPVVNLDVFKDRNFAMGCVFIGATGGTLYAGAVVIPQFAQTVIGYTATWAGLILSPGGIVVILLIPIVGRLMKIVQTRFIIAAGFFIMGLAFLFSSTLAPNIDFKTLVFMRAACRPTQCCRASPSLASLSPQLLERASRPAIFQGSIPNGGGC